MKNESINCLGVILDLGQNDQRLLKAFIRSLFHPLSIDACCEFVEHGDKVKMKVTTKNYLEYDRDMFKPSAEFDINFVVKSLESNGFICDTALAEKLWSRFSQDQCATSIIINNESISRFIEWVKSGLIPNEAWS